MRYISRSSYSEFSECDRRGYWKYLFRGTGLDSASPSLPLTIGIGTHKGLERLMHGDDIDLSVNAAIAEYDLAWARHAEGLDARMTFQVEEGRALVEAMVRGWHRHCYQDFTERYEVLQVEKEVRALLSPNVTLMARADVVVRERDTGEVFVVNWKTTSIKKDWTQAWEDEIQMMTESLAIQDDLGITVRGVIVIGLFKGTPREGTITTPLIYGYRKRSGDGWVYSAEYKRGDGWEKFAVWRTMPIATWIDWISSDVLGEQFLQSAPILKNDDVVRDWLEQVVWHETQADHILRDGSERDKELYFRQKFSKWNCRWCTFKPACKQRTTIVGMLEAGILKPREDHHGQGGDSSGSEHLVSSASEVQGG